MVLYIICIHGVRVIAAQRSSEMVISIPGEGARFDERWKKCNFYKNASTDVALTNRNKSNLSSVFSLVRFVLSMCIALSYIHLRMEKITKLKIVLFPSAQTTRLYENRCCKNSTTLFFNIKTWVNMVKELS